jgi:endonuclease-3
MLMKQQGHSCLGSHRYLHPYLCSWWKVIVFFSSSSLTLSPSFYRPIVAEASFYSAQRRIAFDGRRSTSLNWFPVTQMTETMPSPVTSAAAKYSTLTGSCLRRSTRINKPQDALSQRTGVRLFQQTSDENEDKDKVVGNSNNSVLPENLASADISTDDKGSNAAVTRSRKRTLRSTSCGSDELAGKVTKRTSSKATRGVSTPSRGTKAIPVTPEQGDVEIHSTAARPSKKVKNEKVKEEQTPTKRKPKTANAKGKSTRKRKTATKKPKAIVEWPAPDGWRETYYLVRELRKDKTAPCDVMGAEALALPQRDRTDGGDVDANMDAEEDAKTSRFQTLIALMLSSQTKDAMVGQAMGNLRDTSDGHGGLTVASILEMDPKVLNKKIYSVGFRNNKTKYIKQVVQILHENYNDDIPPSADDMIRDLPGVGPKMAYIIENICWDKQSGIGVDTHMQRLFPKLGWVSPDTKNPEQTRKQLESWLPQEYWGEVNLLWVGFGQETQQEKQKIFRKALQSDRPVEALSLLRSIDFDVSNEWDKLQSSDSSMLDEEKKEDLPWTDDNERKRINKIIEKVMLQN